MNSFKTIMSALLALSCIALGCGDTSSGATAGTTAAECVRGDLVSQCPPNTMPELSANSEAICSSSGEASADAVSGMGRVENVCAGSGSCQLVCRLIDPCEFGVLSVSETDGVICRIPGGCGDGRCETGEDPTSCPQDCEGECSADSSRCVDGQIQRCALNGVFEDPQSCLDEEVCRQDGDTAQCVPAACGDSVIQEGMEQCDDGNTITEPCVYGVESCTVCNAMCMEVAGIATFCGDNIVQEGEEECDDGDAIQSPCPYNETSCTVCDAQCNLVPGEVGSICGDGLVDETNGETCDGDDSTVSDAGACPRCQPAECGDGFPRRDVSDANDPSFEACDDGNDIAFGDGCNNACEMTEEDGPLNIECTVVESEEGRCELDACETDFECVSKTRLVRRDGVVVEGSAGRCQKENNLEFLGEVDGNRVARIQGTLSTEANGPARDADIFAYQQRCGYGHDPLLDGQACTAEFGAQYLFVLDFDVPTQTDDVRQNFPAVGPALVENTCNGRSNDPGEAWTNCLCPEFHPLCREALRNERKRVFWCVSATEVGEYAVRIGAGLDMGWPARTIGYTLEVTEMLNQSGCEEYVPDDDELCRHDTPDI